MKYHLKEISKAQVKVIISKLLKFADSLRSQVAKNALLSLTDLFDSKIFLQNGWINDSDITLSFSTLLKKAADTNQFLSIEASSALSKLVEHTPHQKSIQRLYMVYGEKAVAMRKQVSGSILQIMNSLTS